MSCLLKEASRFLKTVGLGGFSRKKNILGMNPLIVSTLYIALTCFLAKYIRRMINHYVQEGTVRMLLLEFVATAELCACCFELIIVADNYGVWVYALYLFLLTIWWSNNWEGASACPYVPLEEILESGQSATNALSIVVAQLAGGVVIFKYVQVLWSLELAETHKGRALEECSADLQQSMLLGFVLEFVGTCLFRIVAKILLDCKGCLASAAVAFLYTGMVVLASLHKASYFNPIVTTTLGVRCRRFDYNQDIIVYWLGDSLGAINATVVHLIYKESEENVPMVYGALIEGNATCLCRVVSRYLGDSGIKIGPYADAFFSTMLVVAAFNLSGGYFNPALATSLKFGCDGQTFVEFMVVYWLGSCLGALSSVFIYNSLPMSKLLGKEKLE